MVQKKLSPKKKSPKKSQKTGEKQEISVKENIKSLIDNGKDTNNNVAKNEFCKQNHFVCSKFTDDQYKQVRDSLIKLKENHESNGELDLFYLDEILKDHHLLTRYMMRQRRDTEKQIEFIIKVLKWRQENRISMIRKDLFPREALELGPIFPFKKTKTGEIVCYLRFCLYPHNQIDFMDEFSIFQLYVINRLAIDNNTTWIWFFDFSNATKSNIDIKRSRFMIDIMNTYFPFANTKSIVYNLPWYLSFLKPLFFSFLPTHIKNAVGFYDSKNLSELIDSENLPPFLGGTGKLEDCELYRKFFYCDGNPYLDEWTKNPPKEIKLFKEDANIEEICEKAKQFLEKQKELIISLRKKGVII